jgi:hypothetical protein
MTAEAANQPGGVGDRQYKKRRPLCRDNPYIGRIQAVLTGEREKIRSHPRGGIRCPCST